MLDWLAANIGTILVSLILVAVVVLIIVNMRKRKKQGKSSCGCGCSNCAMSECCHKKVTEK